MCYSNLRDGLKNVDLAGLYGISTIVGYSIPNPLYTYISNTYNLITHFVDNDLKGS